MSFWRKAIIAVCVVVLLVGFFDFGGETIDYFAQTFENDSNADAVRAIKEEAAAQAAGQGGAQLPQGPIDGRLPVAEMLPEYKALYDLNPDIVGWLKVEDTRIDYPVMFHEGEGQYYLKRNFDGNYQFSGCLFLDERNRMEPRSENLIIYGHNMNNGSMFHDLSKFKGRKFLDEHPYIYFDTLYRRETYQIIAVLQTRIPKSEEQTFRYYEFVGDGSESSFKAYIEDVKKRSVFDTGVEAAFGDRLLTLSTCDYRKGVAESRLVVIAKLISST
ncbi:MAG: class B sortase [Christensenellaceae bacterium]|nr:class B sortase [Christensenellaceae bacterium]